MTNKLRSVSSLIITMFIITPTILFGQENGVEMADVMRSNGKIYVVVAVISVILAGLLIFIMNIDKRVRRMEKESKEAKP